MWRAGSSPAPGTNRLERLMNRQQRRKLKSIAKKQKNKDLEEKLDLHDKLDESCRVCEKPFDKSDMEMLAAWMVVVREKEKSVNLYCPECWEDAKKIVSRLQEDAEDTE